MARHYTDDELTKRRQAHLESVKAIEKELAERKRKQAEKDMKRAYDYLRRLWKTNPKYTGLEWEEFLTRLENALEQPVQSVPNATEQSVQSVPTEEDSSEYTYENNGYV